MNEFVVKIVGNIHAQTGAMVQTPYLRSLTQVHDPSPFFSFGPLYTPLIHTHPTSILCTVSLLRRLPHSRSFSPPLGLGLLLRRESGRILRYDCWCSCATVGRRGRHAVEGSGGKTNQGSTLSSRLILRELCRFADETLAFVLHQIE